MPSTTPDLRMATACGFGGSGSAPRPAAGNSSCGAASGVGSLAAGALGPGFGSAGHMASKLGGSGGGTGAGGEVRHDGGGSLLAAPPDPLAPAGGDPGDSRGDNETSPSTATDGSSGLRSFGAENRDARSSAAAAATVISSGCGSGLYGSGLDRGGNATRPCAGNGRPAPP